MGDILTRLLGPDAIIDRNSRLGHAERSRGVPPSPELTRIGSLPRKIPRDLERARQDLYTLLRRHDSDAVLWDWQVRALAEAWSCGGLLGGGRVGAGKTLVSLLAPSLIPCQRPLLFVPAGLRVQTIDAIEKWSRHWHIRTDITLMTYEDLSQLKNVRALETLEPDLIVGDEFHRLRRGEAARTKRIETYMTNHPNTRVVALSGTFTRGSLHDLRNIGAWALKDKSPIPRTWKDCEDWTAAIDPESRAPLSPGVLAQLGTGDSPADIVGKRITETPGVCFSEGIGLDIPLYVNRHVIDHKDMDGRFKALRSDDTIEPSLKWSIARQLGLGFEYYYDPEPPTHWLEARKAWAVVANDLIRRKLADSEAGVRGWIENESRDPELIAISERWLYARPDYKIRLKARWYSDHVVKAAADWVARRPHGLVWTPYRAFGQKLSAATGLMYYDDANAMLTAPPGPCIVSINAVGEGVNLQEHWSHNLVVCPPASGAQWTQMVARTHRPGQTRPVVVDAWMTCRENRESFVGAMAEIRQTAALTGDYGTNMLQADIDDANPDRIIRGTGFAWKR